MTHVGTTGLKCADLQGGGGRGESWDGRFFPRCWVIVVTLRWGYWEFVSENIL